MIVAKFSSTESPLHRRGCSRSSRCCCLSLAGLRRSRCSRSLLGLVASNRFLALRLCPQIGMSREQSGIASKVSEDCQGTALCTCRITCHANGNEALSKDFPWPCCLWPSTSRQSSASTSHQPWPWTCPPFWASTCRRPWPWSWASRQPSPWTSRPWALACRPLP